MSKRLFGLLALLTVSSLVLAACGGATASSTTAPAAQNTQAPAASAPFVCTDAIGCVDIAPGDPIHLAWINTVTGATAFLGIPNVRGAEVALDDINFTLLGHPIQWDGEDSLCSQEGGQTAGAKIASDPTVVAIVGTTCSGEARGAMPLISAAGMVMISPSNTNPDLTNPDHPDHWVGYLRTAHNDLFQGRIAAEFAYNELGFTTAATMHDGSPYAESLQQVFADVFTELGGTITAQAAINVGDTDMGPVLTSIATGSPQILYFPIFEPEGPLVAAKKCSVSGLENTALMGADGLLTTGFSHAAGACALGMYLSGPYVAGDAMSAFLAKYVALFGEGPTAGFSPHANDAMNMILAAIQTVAVVDADGTVHIGRQALRDALYGTTAFPGLTGSLTCDANGDCATGEALAVFQVSQANIDFVGTAGEPGDLLVNTPFWQPGQ
jgi:branched-chain amino acid transport system substrate-binding protein